MKEEIEDRNRRVRSMATDPVYLRDMQKARETFDKDMALAQKMEPAQAARAREGARNRHRNLSEKINEKYRRHYRLD